MLSTVIVCKVSLFMLVTLSSGDSIEAAVMVCRASVVVMVGASVMATSGTFVEMDCEVPVPMVLEASDVALWASVVIALGASEVLVVLSPVLVVFGVPEVMVLGNSKMVDV